ncbi:MAG: glucokinase [Cyanobium sp.]
MITLLAGDIGGTKTLLSLHAAADLRPLAEARYRSADWPDLAAMVCHFLAEHHPANPRPAAACFAVAGPVQAGQARLTNLPWHLEEGDLARRCSLERVELVNDFAVLIYGLPHLQAHQQALIRPGQAQAGAPLLILGAGTGLGVAIGIPTDSGLQAVASEAAHADFAPRNSEQWELRQWLCADLNLPRLSIERIVSGTGLGHVARWLLRRPQWNHHPLTSTARLWREEAAEHDLPAAVAAAATAGDPLGGEALALWLSTYGAVCGDLALACLPRGGIWLAGGTAGKLLEALRSPVFSEAYLAKGRLSPVLEPIPIQAVTDAAIGSFSAACRARMLLA